jgi:hypothetical protein
MHLPNETESLPLSLERTDERDRRLGCQIVEAVQGWKRLSGRVGAENHGPRRPCVSSTCDVSLRGGIVRGSGNITGPEIPTRGSSPISSGL